MLVRKRAKVLQWGVNLYHVFEVKKLYKQRKLLIKEMIDAEII